MLGGGEDNDLAAAVASDPQKQAEQLHQRDRERCYIGERGGRKNLLCLSDLLAVEQTALIDGFEGTAAGIELNRERYKLKHKRKAKTSQTNVHQRIGLSIVHGGIQNEANQNQRHCNH